MISRYLDSNCIERVAYDPATREMIIEFARSSKEYSFRDVPPWTFEGLCSASSAGEYYHEYIRGNFQQDR